MSISARNLTASQAAASLGVSIKALRLYEREGLIAPGRTPAGWRAYGPGEMACARKIVSLRTLGLSLKQVGRVRRGDPAGLDAALAAHEARLQEQSRRIAESLDRIRRLRSDIVAGQAPAPGPPPAARVPHCCQSRESPGPTRSLFLGTGAWRVRRAGASGRGGPVPRPHRRRSRRRHRRGAATGTGRTPGRSSAHPARPARR